MKNFLSKLLSIVLFFLVLIFSFDFDIKKQDNSKKYISVEVRGEVEKEESYTLELGSTFNDLLSKIDLKESADISDISLNYPLYNKQVINIRSKEENKLISINNATLKELETIPGIGEVMAKKIIEYRQINGSFSNLEDLKHIKGIGDKKFENIKQYISL